MFFIVAANFKYETIVTVAAYHFRYCHHQSQEKVPMKLLSQPEIAAISYFYKIASCFPKGMDKLDHVVLDTPKKTIKVTAGIDFDHKSASS